MTDLHRFNEMFDYLSTVPAPEEPAGILAFGRKDPRVASAIGATVMESQKGLFVVISGGIGKDSGDLNIPEANYLEDELYREYPDYFAAPVYLETRATNGGENVRNSLALMERRGLDYRSGLIAVAHATSARRLMETTRHEAIKNDTPIARLSGVATDYPFNAENPDDQKEAVQEMARLATWPEKNWLQPVDDLPQDLADFAVDLAQTYK